VAGIGIIPKCDFGQRKRAMLFGAAPFHLGLVSFGFHGLEDGVVAVKLLACQTWRWENARPFLKRLYR
jgi:hypothetical protein